MSGRWRSAGGCVLIAALLPALSLTADLAAAAASPPQPPPTTPPTPGSSAATPRAAGSAGDATTDQRLQDAMDQSSTVAVEVMTQDVAAVATQVRRLGGVVTGSVTGAVVQAVVPSNAVERLAVTSDVSFVQSPRVVNRPYVEPPRRPELGPGTGPVVGQNVDLTNAAAWQAAGIVGAVKVGILDYFDLKLWSAVEAGDVPDAAHRFCQDTSGPPASSSDNLCNESHSDGVNSGDGFEHGVAVAQVLKDIAPGAELYLASAATISDTSAAVNWFIANGVHIVTRSLGAAYDGPGDGTGPLADVVDHAVANGITWFNSAGNDAADGYARITVPDNLSSTNGYVDFDNGPGVDTYLRVSGSCALLDGIRWSDWYLPPALRTDYDVEVWAPTVDPGSISTSENYNPPANQLVQIGSADDMQTAGAPPLEGADQFFCPPNRFGPDLGVAGRGITYLRIHRKAGTPVVGPPDVMEIGLGFGLMELGRSQAPFSAAKPVVDSRNPGMLAVGAIDPADGSGVPDALGFYSSQGPTNDGRVKPDIVAPSCVASAIYAPSCFNGTSAASPTAAGVAALLLSAAVALPGVPLADAMRHFAFDRPFNAGGAPDGADNKYGLGQIRLPSPPTPAPQPTTSAYHGIVPTRILDTRVGSAIGQPELFGFHRPHDILDVTVAGVGAVAADATAVAVNVTTDQSGGAGYIQVVPYLRSPYGASSTLNIPGVNVTLPNFAVVPVGSDGKISIYTVPGGHMVVDVLGYFSASGSSASAGRFVSIDPVRTLDTRTSNLLPPGFVPHKPNAESVVVPPAAAVPTSGVSALVLHVTATEADLPGYLRAQPDGTVPPSSTTNFVPGVNAANTVIVPLGADGKASVFTNVPAHIVVDVTGYITDGNAPVSSSGLFVPLPTGRAYDSRNSPNTVLPSLSPRAVQLVGLPAPLLVPPSASAISINLTAVDGVAPGFLTAYPADVGVPPTSSLNYVANDPVANGALLKLSAGGALAFLANQPTDYIVDVDGYFT